MRTACVLLVLCLSCGCTGTSVPVPDFDEVLRDDSWEYPLPGPRDDEKLEAETGNFPDEEAVSPRRIANNEVQQQNEGVVSGLVIHADDDFFIVKQASREFVFLVFAGTEVGFAPGLQAVSQIRLCQTVKVYYSRNNNAYFADFVKVIEDDYCRR